MAQNFKFQELPQEIDKFSTNGVNSKEHQGFLFEMMNFNVTGICIIDIISEQLIWFNVEFREITGISFKDIQNPFWYDPIIQNLEPTSAKRLCADFKMIKDNLSSSFSRILHCHHHKKGCLSVYIKAMVHKPSSDPCRLQLLVCVIDLTSLLHDDNLIGQFELKRLLPRKRESDLIGLLSKREKQVVKLIAKGFTDKEIGIKLYISPATAKTHRKKIIRKLKMKNTASLVRFATEYGLK